MRARGAGTVWFFLVMGGMAAAAIAAAPPPAEAPSTKEKPGPRTASEEEVAAVCRRVLCRPPRPIHLKLPGGKSFDFTPPGPTPIVSGGLVTVLAGEKVMVEGTLRGGEIVDLVAVKAIAHPERTLIFELHQDPKIEDGTTMVLKVTSPFAGAMKYRVGMMRPEDDRLLKTSSCPVSQGTPVFESWPHPIFQLVATDLRIVDPKSPAATRCE